MAPAPPRRGPRTEWQDPRYDVLYGDYDPLDQEAKMRHYAFVQQMAERFRRENGTIICRELLGLPEGSDAPTPEARTETYYRNRPCAEYVGSAAAILETVIREREEDTAGH